MRKEISNMDELESALKDDGADFVGNRIDPEKLERAEKLKDIAEKIADMSRFYSWKSSESNDKDFFSATVYVSNMFPSSIDNGTCLKLLNDGASLSDKWFISTDEESPYNMFITFIVRDYWLE